jgi:large subunit ribosomal protein L10
LALTRQEKEQLLQEYDEKAERAQVMIWANYKALRVAQITNLRNQLRQVGNAEAVVVKNTLLQRVLEEKNLPTSEDLLSGPSVVTFVYDDLAANAKTVSDFARLNEAFFQVKGGIVGGRVVGPEGIRALADLPSREVLLARVLGGIQAPVSGFVTVLSGVVRGFMNVLNARAEQLEEAASGQAAG